MREMMMGFLHMLLVAGLALAHTPAGQDSPTSGYPELPRDARRVAERSIACRHYADEFMGMGDARDREVNRQLGKLRCHSLEKDAERMRRKYRDDPEVLRLINEALEWLAG
ncbi:hypothetical protein [Luteimonas sp. e5]